jgi:signal transduction histidine kinase
MTKSLLFGCVWVALIIPLLSYGEPTTSTWGDALKNGKGEVTVFWHESRPFIYRTSRGKIQGIEYEIMEGFRRYLADKKGIRLTIHWVETKSFADCYAQIASKNIDGTFGASAFSIIPERQREIGFSPSYIADASVLISSKNLPIVKSEEEFRILFSKKHAITILGTTYEKDLFRLRDQLGVPFSVEYIHSSENILRAIQQRDDCFGYIDLPVYLMMFSDNPSIAVKRQNILSIKREGYGIIYPLQSSWANPIHDYFLNSAFETDLAKVVPKYLDHEVYRIVENLIAHSDNPIELLSKEKEIQSRNLEEKTNQIQSEERTRNLLIVLSAFSIMTLILIIVMYQKRNKQKDQIELQRQNIELKNLQLEKRNEHLLAIDEEKNNLIKILAHDLRTPINQVQGLAQLLIMEKDSLSTDQREVTQKITEATLRLNKMITNILDIDSLENNRVNIFTEQVKVYPLLSQVVKSFEKNAQKKNINLQLMAGNSDLTIKGDPLFLTQIFENLISNALKFSPAGKPVNVHIDAFKNKVRIIVEDFGPGLTPEDQQQAFRKFAKLSAKPTGGESSTGLGLSIVKKYVEMMRGFVWCESEPNKVTRFITEFEKV